MKEIMPIGVLVDGKDPIASLRRVKSLAIPTCQMSAPLGEGDVGIENFIKKLKEIGYTGPLTIEREISGKQQIKDILKAKTLLERLI